MGRRVADNAHGMVARNRVRRNGLGLIAGLIALAGLGGCQDPKFVTPDRLNQGLILILPGIEGKSILNRSIAKGLNEAGVPDAIDILDWTSRTLLVVGNELDYDRNLRQAAMIAYRIRNYQRAHPGKPVHLIGHSAGGGMAVLAAEQLSKNHPIDAAILLGASLSQHYNLTGALERTKYGIYNFYSPGEVLFLGAGTSVAGTLDRTYAPAAGMMGFKPPPAMSAEGRKLYEAKLHQISWSEEMIKSGHIGGHFGWANPWFVKEYLGRIILSHHASRSPEL